MVRVWVVAYGILHRLEGIAAFFLAQTVARHVDYLKVLEHGVTFQHLFQSLGCRNARKHP